MRKLAAVMCLSLFVVAANAGIVDDNGIQFWFSHQGDANTIPAEYAAQTTLTTTAYETVYVWCTTVYPDYWNGCSLDWLGSGPRHLRTGCHLGYLLQPAVDHQGQPVGSPVGNRLRFRSGS